MNHVPKISIIIPVWNGGKYLAPALESVRNQTYSDWECICINNGSTDNSLDIIKDFMRKDPRFVLIGRADNGGVSVGRNAGLDVACGEYITFLDQDDLLAPYAFAHYLELFEKYGPDMVRGTRIKVPHDFSLAEAQNHKLSDRVAYFNNDNLTDYFVNDISQEKYMCYSYMWMCLLKADMLKKYRFIPELFSGGEDCVLMTEFMDNIKSYVQTDSVIIFYRVSSSSTTQSGTINPNLIRRFSVVVPWLCEYSKKCLHPKLLNYKLNIYMHCMYWECLCHPMKENKHWRVGREVLKTVYKIRGIRWRYLTKKQRLKIWMFVNFGRWPLSLFIK